MARTKRNLDKHKLNRNLITAAIAALLLSGCKPSSSVESEARKFYSLDTQTVMLKHMSSKFSDQELRDLWKKAEIERLNEITKWEKETNQYYSERAAALAQCNDIAFKTKNPETCSSASVVPIGILAGPAVNSQQDIFNNYVLGSCNWVDVKKAKEIGCFPKDYTPTFVTLEELKASKQAK